MSPAAELHVAESEIVSSSLMSSRVLVPVDSDGGPMKEFVIREILNELDRAKKRKDWSVPYHR